VGTGAPDRKVAFIVIVRLLVTLGCLGFAAAAAGQALEHLGSFGNVTSKDGGEHCGGYSLGLWKHGNEILGLLDVHSGLCGDPPCSVIDAAELNPRTGRLRFDSTVDGRKFRFDGALGRGAVDGRFNGKRTRLARDDTGAGGDFEPNRSVPAWCGFWGSVTRCKGVREKCEAMRVR